MILLASEAR